MWLFEVHNAQLTLSMSKKSSIKQVFKLHISHSYFLLWNKIHKHVQSKENENHLCDLPMSLRASLVSQKVKHLPAMRKTQVWSLDREDPLEKEMATHSSTLAWRIPWMEEPGRLQSMGLQRVRHDWETLLSLSFTLRERNLPSVLPYIINLLPLQRVSTFLNFNNFLVEFLLNVIGF